MVFLRTATMLSKRTILLTSAISFGAGLGSQKIKNSMLEAESRLSLQDSIPVSNKMEAFVKQVQKNVTSAIEEIEGPSGAKFLMDNWKRQEGGYGCSAVLQNGRVFEKGGVNFSIIASAAPKSMLEQMRARKPMGLKDNMEYDMFVAGVSLVIHPHNPMTPTFHANYRYFELRERGSEYSLPPSAAWFGGGCDLTPSYLFEEDAIHFHRVIKDVCDKHDVSYYPRFKKWCDEYFQNTHRGEARGIGGIFFDDLDHGNLNNTFKFVSDCGNALAEQYIPIVKRRMNLPYTEKQKEWQQLRRGRYVEFNLIHDRGTKFGLVTPNVRIESVLMSLPLTARWQYMHTPEPGSPEDQLVEVLRKPRNWV